jgi:hypothetical protein
LIVAFCLVAASCSPSRGTAMGLCVTPDLRAALYGGEGATGHANTWVVLYNTGKRPCVVSGPARLALYDAGGGLVSASEGLSPYIRAGLPTLTGPFRIDNGTKPEDHDGKRKGLAWASAAQGPCPGGVFPKDGKLEIVLADAGRVPVERFTGTLPFDYRCVTANAVAKGKPQLLVSRLAGSKPVQRASSPSP